MVASIAQIQARLESQIHIVRGQRVMLDTVLAGLYGATTSALNQAVKRNRSRFPVDFAFQISSAELGSLRSQSVISNKGRGGRRSPPWVFTEHGAIMAASLLNSRRAVETSIYIVRAFVRLRESATAHAELLGRLKELERKLGDHDEDLKALFGMLRRILSPPRVKNRQIGFHMPLPRTRSSSST